MNVQYQDLVVCVVRYVSTHQALMNVSVMLDIVYQVMDSYAKVASYIVYPAVVILYQLL